MKSASFLIAVALTGFAQMAQAEESVSPAAPSNPDAAAAAAAAPTVEAAPEQQMKRCRRIGISAQAGILLGINAETDVAFCRSTDRSRTWLEIGQGVGYNTTLGAYITGGLFATTELVPDNGAAVSSSRYTVMRGGFGWAAGAMVEPGLLNVDPKTQKRTWRLSQHDANSVNRESQRYGFQVGAAAMIASTQPGAAAPVSGAEMVRANIRVIPLTYLTRIFDRPEAKKEAPKPDLILELP